MKIGTKSVLFGAHCFFIHPWFVALAWWKLYGFQTVQDPFIGPISLKDPRLWIAFILHDLGYWGKPNMDGQEGEKHPFWAANVMRRFDRNHWSQVGYAFFTEDLTGKRRLRVSSHGPWACFVLFHSRFLARRYNQPYSLLCVADKLAIALEPWWLYLPRVIATGEIREYMALAGSRNLASKYAGEPKTRYELEGRDLVTRRGWHRNMTEYCRSWAFTHRDGRQDEWTSEVRVARDVTGVWQ